MRQAYVSMMCAGDGYLPGLEALARSLHAARAGAPLVAMVTAEVSPAARARLIEEGWQLRAIESIANPVPEGELLYPRFANVFTKLRAWELADIDKAVFLDADTIVLQNIDELFERPAIAAAPDFMLPDQFNSGVMVLEPSSQTFAAMMRALSASGSYDGGDQGFLNQFYPDWYALPSEHRLPMVYNTHHFIFQYLEAHPAVRAQMKRDIKIVHYTLQKPWNGSMVSGGAALWWQTYHAPNPDGNRGWRRRVHELEDRGFMRLVSLMGA